MVVGAAVSIQQITQPLVPAALPWQAAPTLAGAVVGGWILLRLDGRPPSSLGFPLDRTVPGALGGGLALGTALGLAAVALIALAGAVRWRSEAGGVGGWLGTGLATLWLLLIPAAAEEAMLRGYLFQALIEAWGAGRALVVTSLMFALLHLPNPSVGWLGLANIAAAGCFLGALYLRTGSLWWATGAHLGWNWALGFLADLPVSGLDLVNAPLLEPSLSGPAWVSGDGFGPEGSALATLAVAAAAAWTWRSAAAHLCALDTRGSSGEVRGR